MLTIVIFDLLSFTVDQPDALIETMLSRLPFVASDIPSIKETVNINVNLYNPMDIEGFVYALERLYVEQLKRNINLKEDTIKRFDYKERFEEFYNKLF